MAKAEPSQPPRIKIPGGCPDGVWSLELCNYAAKIGTCTLTDRVDRRTVTVAGDTATVTREVQGG